MTTAFVNRMKEQTFGVEVEMNNITRENAAKVAAKYFGDATKYSYTGSQDNYMTWSAWDASGRKWKFSKDSSISGSPSEQTELVTPVLKYEDMELLQGLLRVLRKAGAKSDYTRGCGVHIHVGSDGHTAASLRNLVNMMASHEDLLAHSVNIAESRLNWFCRRVDTNFLSELNRKKPQTLSELADVWYYSQGCNSCRNSHYNSSRYHMLNLHATFTRYRTIEFRLFQFEPEDEYGKKKNGLHAGKMKAFINLSLALSQMAKEKKNASCKPTIIQNPKEAIKSWLFSLGLKGEEFKNTRAVFMRGADEYEAQRMAA